MHNIQIKTKVITNRILFEIRDLTHRSIKYAGVVADIVRDILSDDKELDNLLRVQWDQEKKKGVCPFTPEQLLELAPSGFNGCPMDSFTSGEVDLRTAIEFCFQQTFYDAWDAGTWEEELGKDLPDFEYDLFRVEYGERTKEEWLATNSEGRPLREPYHEDAGKTEKKGKKGKKPDLKLVKN